MRTREELEKRVKELEAEVASLRGLGIRRPVRYRSEFTFGGLPLLAVATGPDIARGEVRGHARGIIAIGTFAIGGGALGGAAIGGGAVGMYACGGGVAGQHTVGPGSRDPEALSFFAQYGLEGFCQGSRRHRPAR